jgi:hypothetical protein
MAGGRDDAAIAQALASMAQVLAQANEQAAPRTILMDLKGEKKTKCDNHQASVQCAN